MLLVFIIGLFQLVSLSDSFPSYCDLHTSQDDTEATRRYIIPRGIKFSHSWLPTNKKELMHYYNIGMTECNSFLSNANQSSRFLSHKYPPPYQPHDQKPSEGQGLCRGNSMLYGLTGVLLWRFGPSLNECSTYQHCWWGVLRCGQPKEAAIKELPLDRIKFQLESTSKSRRSQANQKTSVPSYLGFSLRSIYINSRVIGKEIVVPETRWLNISSTAEALIFRFSLTQPYSNVHLEARLQEFYPSSLFNWSRELADERGMSYAGFVYLGGTEERCRTWSRCAMSGTSTIPLCDTASMLVNPNLKSINIHQPVTFSVKRGSCDVSTALPLCVGHSSYPGRWVAADTNLCLKNKPSSSSTPSNLELLASGNPCVMSNMMSGAQNITEEGNVNRWFFSPWRCRYHYYTLPQLGTCFVSKNISHIFFQGDSMTRDMYAAVQKMLGIAGVSEKKLKNLTNREKKKLLTATVSLGGKANAKVLLTEGYFWDPSEMASTWNMLKDDWVDGPPQVIVANYAFAHRGEHPYELGQSFEQHAGHVWAQNFSSTGPRWRFFLTARDPRGLKDVGRVWNAHASRLRSNVLERFHAKYGFTALDDFIILEGRYDGDTQGLDGWHHYGSTRMMEATLLFNMLCNDLVKSGVVK